MPDSVESRNRLARFAPGLAMLARYDRRWLPRDLLAGLSVAAVALPVGIAYADIVRVPVIIGIYSAIFPLFAYAIFGSSRQLIVGPDAATCLLVAASLAAHAGGDPQRYLDLMMVLSLLTGLVYLIASLCRLGFIANFLSLPILTGYMNGIALIILVGQLPKIFGYRSPSHDFLSQIRDFITQWNSGSAATVWLGLSILVGLLILRRVAPIVPSALIGVVAGILAVVALNLQSRGVAVVGELPSGLPAPRFPSAEPAAYLALLEDAVAIMLVSFAGSMLAAKIFAQRNRYTVDANQELAAIGVANIVSGVFQGFAVTGTDSRTAVNNAVGGRSQLVSIAAAAVMLLILLFVPGPLALVPTAALGAVVFVSALGLFEIGSVALLGRMSWREGLLSLITTLGVLVLGVVPGVGIAIALTLVWLLMVASRPQVAVLGRVPGLDGHHSIADYPQAATVPGLLIFRFESNLLFFNTDYFGDRLRAAIAASPTPVSWVVIDASPVNWIDASALQYIWQLHADLAARGITLGFAGVKQSLRRPFNPGWARRRWSESPIAQFATLAAATAAFERRKGLVAEEVRDTGKLFDR